MKLLDATAIYYALTKTSQHPHVSCSPLPNYSLTKVAFDTRRINQETEYNPRHNIQYYHRSEGFIEKDTAAMIKTFAKLKNVVDQIKHKYIGNPEWLDSYCRILSASLDRILRDNQQDADYFKPHLDYLEELLDMRYRLKLSDIETFGEEKLQGIILGKDEKLAHTLIYNEPLNKNSNAPAMDSINTLLTQLLGPVKASDDNKSVERSITITIRDTVLDKIIK